MKKMILKTDEIMKAGDEVFSGGMKNIVQSNITKDNVVVIALIVTIGTVDLSQYFGQNFRFFVVLRHP